MKEIFFKKNKTFNHSFVGMYHKIISKKTPQQPGIHSSKSIHSANSYGLMEVILCEES